MSFIKDLYRRLDSLQRRRVARYVLTGLSVVLIVVLFGSLLATTYRIDSYRQSLREVLSTENYEDGDPSAVLLHDTGSVILRGKTFSDPLLAERADLIFLPDGRVANPDSVVEILLRSERPDWAPRWLVDRPGTTWMLTFVAVVWLILIVWMGLTVPFILTLLCTGVPVLLGKWIGANRMAVAEFGSISKLVTWLANEELQLFLLGLGLLIFTFVLLSRAMLAFFNWPNQAFAIAHTVIKEASRLHLTLFFIVLLLILLPLLPVTLDETAPLRFRVQTFISRSLTFTYIIAACFTLFLGCASVAFEIRDRQIWQLVSKPVGRLQYLLGKWLGVMALNLIILSIAGVSTFTYIQYLRDQPTARGQAGLEDRRQLNDAVLTARIGDFPRYEDLATDQVRQRVEQHIRNDPELSRMAEVPMSKRRQIASDIIERYYTALRTVPHSGAGRTYRFEGLSEAKSLQANLSLRYKFHILRDDEHEQYDAIFVMNGLEENAIRQRYVPTVTHILTIPATFIQDDGSLEVTVHNMYTPPPGDPYGSINFDKEDFELLYKVGSFESNFLRAVIGAWIKLSFLAMLAIACATFLSFPVACLMSFTIFAAASVGPFLAASLDEYNPPPTAAMDWANIGMVIQWAFESFVKKVAEGLVWMLRPFGELRTTQNLVEGRIIRTGSLLRGFAVIGLLWSGIGLVVGYLVFRARQLAIYSGNG